MKRVSARGIMMDAEGRLCLMRRIKHGKEYWVIPGGGVEEGESFHEALRREMMEEIGSTITAISQEPVLTFENTKGIHHFFMCREVTRTTPTGPEHTVSSESNYYEIQFIALDALEEIYVRPARLKEQIIRLARGEEV